MYITDFAGELAEGLIAQLEGKELIEHAITKVDYKPGTNVIVLTVDNKEQVTLTVQFWLKSF